MYGFAIILAIQQQVIMLNETRTIFFDLGNTLLYRSEPLIISDAKLINKIGLISPVVILGVLSKHSFSFPGVYSRTEDNKKLTSLDIEMKYYSDFFNIVFDELKIKYDMTSFIDLRCRDKRYSLYPNTLGILKKLKSNGYQLGIITNGRPSRQIVMDNLGISKYVIQNIFISDVLGFAKPSRRIFEYARSKIVGSIALCDDDISSLNSAKKIGYDTIHIDHKHKLGFSSLSTYLANCQSTDENGTPKNL
ncbi:hypothetical protein A2982_00715 [candidate division WWE3 bacterium RIFCSPLOWO2_01_FULL_39_13]|uniref:HAD family hydrolase n=1 Tax=candidate division WWE3 bacterium RIFCSPLOWO2_01_FULL_39_13 TaxID=1802624 RepID=A0A1F4V5A8_UNCKA|nr:MAG: hypothetical protein A2982_00715 [candidate division WWE3 bacterium RIFCSPLOWO2_01_FULL_39_13]